MVGVRFKPRPNARGPRGEGREGGIPCSCGAYLPVSSIFFFLTQSLGPVGQGSKNGSKKGGRARVRKRTLSPLFVLKMTNFFGIFRIRVGEITPRPTTKH